MACRVLPAANWAGSVPWISFATRFDRGAGRMKFLAFSVDLICSLLIGGLAYAANPTATQQMQTVPAGGGSGPTVGGGSLASPANAPAPALANDGAGGWTPVYNFT